MIRILGICGSPVKDSNTELLLKTALDSVRKQEVQTELVTLHDKNIADCIHCNWCMIKQVEGRYCSIEDDMAGLYPKLLECDALLLATPVYIARLSGRLAAALDRIRAIDYGKRARRSMKYKVGAGLAVSWYRHAGIETTLTTLHWAFLTWQMVIATPGSLSTFGGGAVSSLGGTGQFDPKDKHQVLLDSYGIETAKATASSLVELARVMRYGRARVEAH